MKKKLKYITLEELDRICGKYEECDDCPLYRKLCLRYSLRLLDLDTEVEVND